MATITTTIPGTGGDHRDTFEASTFDNIATSSVAIQESWTTKKGTVGQAHLRSQLWPAIKPSGYQAKFE